VTARRPPPAPKAAPRRYSFERYLAAKRTVDDRALNAHVWHALADAVAVRASPRAVHVLEPGAGIGTMAERLLESGLVSSMEYTGIEAQAKLAQRAVHRLRAWGVRRRYAVSGRGARLVLRRGSGETRLTFHAGDVLKAAPRLRGSADVLMAHAFLDLLDLPTALPVLLATLRPGGLFHFSLNFDGVTAFEPAIDPALDGAIESLYHRTMDERRVGGRLSGDSRTGRHLFAALRHAGAEVQAAGASDWVVTPLGGSYAHDEAYFLHFIIHTLHGALRTRSELDGRSLTRWVERRHRQIERGELTYIAHQLDVFGAVRARRPASG
jgi:SAM-dependent methyltransferase